MNETGEGPNPLPECTVGGIVCYKETRNVLLLHRRVGDTTSEVGAGKWGFLKAGMFAGQSNFQRIKGVLEAAFPVAPSLSDERLIDVVETPEEFPPQTCCYYAVRALEKFDVEALACDDVDAVKWTHVDNIRTMLDGTGTQWESGVKEMLLKNYNKIFDYIIRIRG